LLPSAGGIGQEIPEQLSRTTRRIGRAINHCEESAMPSDILMPQAIAAGIRPSAAFDRFRRRLVGLARAHLGARLKSKVDAEDVVQSAYKSLLIRCGEAAVAAEGWDALWGLLTLITIRKCADRARYYATDCRNLHREAEPADGAHSTGLWIEAPGREPTPDEAIVLAETVEDLIGRLQGNERTIVELSLQGYSTQEISQQTGRAERSVRRVREQVRRALERS
jgi:RNA polymerase sigma-70 factor, ECF subfamily